MSTSQGHADADVGPDGVDGAGRPGGPARWLAIGVMAAIGGVVYTLLVSTVLATLGSELDARGVTWLGTLSLTVLTWVPMPLLVLSIVASGSAGRTIILQDSACGLLRTHRGWWLTLTALPAVVVVLLLIAAW